MGNDLLLALRASQRTVSDRVHYIDVELRNRADSTKYTNQDLQQARVELAELECAIEAIKIHRKCVPLAPARFDKLLKVKDLRAILSHPEDQEKPVWAFVQQSAAYEHIVGIGLEEYNGKPTINLLINVLPDGKKTR